MSRQRFTGRGHNTAAFRSSSKRLGPITNTVALIVLACLLGLLYLTQVQLKTEQDNLEVASARLQSLDRVQTSEAAQSLVSARPTAVLQ